MLPHSSCTLNSVQDEVNKVKEIIASLHSDLIKHLFDCPHVIRDLRFHGGSDAEGLVNPAEVVIHVVDRDGIGVVFDFLGEAVT